VLQRAFHSIHRPTALHTSNDGDSLLAEAHRPEYQSTIRRHPGGCHAVARLGHAHSIPTRG